MLTGSDISSLYVAEAARAIDEHNHEDNHNVKLNLKSVIINGPPLIDDTSVSDQNSQAGSSPAQVVHSHLYGARIQGLWELCEE